MEENSGITVNPLNIPEFLTNDQREGWVLFGILVANKPAEPTWRKLRQIMDWVPEGSPFERVRSLIHQGQLGFVLRKTRVGQYARIERAFREAVELDVTTMSVAQLEQIHGIGPKTARMVMLYSFPDVEVVPLDTHILKELRALGYQGVPKNTPPAGRVYAKWEAIFIDEAKRAGMSVRAFDSVVWRKYAKAFESGRRG